MVLSNMEINKWTNYGYVVDMSENQIIFVYH